MKLLTFAHRGEAQSFFKHFEFESVDFFLMDYLNQKIFIFFSQMKAHTVHVRKPSQPWPNFLLTLKKSSILVWPVVFLKNIKSTIYYGSEPAWPIMHKS